MTRSLIGLEAAYNTASSELRDAHWDHLVRTIGDRVPSAFQFALSGEYPEIGAELSLHIAMIWDSDGEELDFDDDLDDDLHDSLDWLGTLDPDLGREEERFDLDTGFRYVKVVAVLRVAEHTVFDDPTAVFSPQAIDELQFVGFDDGYAGEFDSVGADPSSWTPV